MRDTKGLYCSTAILYNHESPRRGEKFVTKKIVSNLVKIKNGEISYFTLGDLKSVRDWGYAKDYVRGMWLMCQQANPRDYILATGEEHQVADFVSYAAHVLGIPDWGKYVHEDMSLIPHNDDIVPIGDSGMVKRELKWHTSVNFCELVKIMVLGELNGTLD